MKESNFSICHCVGVDFSSYANCVSMKCPFLDSLEDWVDIDTCIATEIGWLWHQGVHTWNSCCGHQKTHATVLVTPESIDLMEQLGYDDWAESHDGIRAYLLRTGTQHHQLETPG